MVDSSGGQYKTSPLYIQCGIMDQNNTLILRFFLNETLIVTGVDQVCQLL